MSLVKKVGQYEFRFYSRDMNTLGKLFLGSEPISVRIEDDQLIVMLADKRTLAIPLAFVSQVSQLQPLSGKRNC